MRAKTCEIEPIAIAIINDVYPTCQSAGNVCMPTQAIKPISTVSGMYFTGVLKRMAKHSDPKSANG